MKERKAFLFGKEVDKYELLSMGLSFETLERSLEHAINVKQSVEKNIENLKEILMVS